MSSKDYSNTTCDQCSSEYCPGINNCIEINKPLRISPATDGVQA